MDEIVFMTWMYFCLIVLLHAACFFTLDQQYRRAVYNALHI